MAHFDYPPGTPLGTVPVAYEVPETDWEHVIITGFKSVNGDDGGTWAPGSFITIGGSGLQLTGTGHELASAARLTVQALASIRIEDGGGILANGTTGDITLEVTSGTAQIEAGNGTVIKVLAGGALDIYGAITLKNTSGPGSFTAEANSTSTWLSSSTATFASGSTLNLSGSTLVRGTLTIKASGGPGELIQEAGTFAQFSGTTWFVGETSFVSSTWPVLAPTRSWSRAGKILHVLSYNGASTGPADPDAWSEVSDLTNAPCWRTSDLSAAGGLSLIEFTDLPIGGEITDVTITTKGTDVLGIISTLPTYRIVSWDDSGSSGFTNHSALTTDDHPLVAQFAFVVVQTTVDATGSPTVTAGRRYGLLINHPYDVGTEQGMRIYEITMNGTATSMRI